ncbi:MAG TPA: hypothetical protein VHD84_00855 [Candidatus Saccharimonadales bacterium]|nr:hypothetical protein [Candidatus Saccharimonadales bacterium]
MDQAVLINKEVNIVAYYFKNTSRRLRCFPKRMEYEGKRVNFTETGLVHPTKKGQRLIHIFDMTDGTADYRLEFDAQDLSWKLIAILDSHYAPISTQFAPAA